MSWLSRRPTRRTVLRGLSLVSASGFALGPSAPLLAADKADGPTTLKRLTGVTSWGYQLQNVDPAVIAKSPYDLVVIDYSRDGADEHRFRPEEVAQMQRKAPGGRRLVLAYLSIGEAEDYRIYWNGAWVEPDLEEKAAKAHEAAREKLESELEKAEARNDERAVERIDKELEKLADKVSQIPRRLNSETAPPWLAEENEDWRSNFFVKYWEKGWQDLIFGNPQALLDKILAAGFDGVYLDRVDAIYQFEDERPAAREDMVDFVVRLVEYARARNPAFLVVPQNGEELLRIPTYLGVIDAIAKEDLFYGTVSEPAGKVRGKAKSKAAAGRPQKQKMGQLTNTAKEVKTSVQLLEDASAAGLPVLVVEYLDERKAQGLIADAKRKISNAGYVGYFGVRDLDQLVMPGQNVASPSSTGRHRGEAHASSQAATKSNKRKPKR